MKHVSFSRKALSWMLAIVGLSIFSYSALAAELDAEAVNRGKAASAICGSCHQADGSGMNIPNGESWPRLSGLNRDYLVRQVNAFQQGTRKSPTMTPFASMLNDTQLFDVASYYASLPAKPISPPKVDAALLEHGKKLALYGDWDRYIVSCTSCHGPDNQGNGAEFPAIAGQHPGYIAQELVAWQQGIRTNDPQHLMAAIAERLNSHDIAAVSAWLASQPAM